VILRIWSAALDPARLEEYRRFEAERSLPMLHRQPGFLGVFFLRAAEDRAASITIWEDRGAVEASESSPSYRRTARELADSGLLLTGEPSVKIRAPRRWWGYSPERGAPVLRVRRRRVPAIDG
jgi:heme-degrading monooxygenase HmoA